ncbi:uncharacterized protein LOC143542617 [Bidens hawaiensis]|uniref:uncharacterized protein LOC143542617 n=1 Tax=Bidens hawaiensis TaxID=980011 RepID=UPI00404AECF1
MKAFRRLTNCYYAPSLLRAKNFTGFVNTDAISNPISSEWRERAFSKLIKLSHLLKGLDLINGRLVDVQDECVAVNNEFFMQSMHAFKSIGAAFVIPNMHTCANKPIYKEPFAISSLKKVCDVLTVSAQHRKLVRLAICPQVTLHQIWMGTLIEILNQLKDEMSVKGYRADMAQQIVVNCLRLLDDAISYDPDSTSWMRLAPKKDADSPPSVKWADFLEMFNDLVTCLQDNHKFLFYVMKIEIMKEGLLQIKDGLVDKNIGYKEARHQQSLVQKKLTKSLGHSSRCLFTLLLYYLYGSVDDIEIDVCCWLSEDVGGDRVCLCVGKIMTSDGDKMLMHVVKQLDRALGVVKFVHELAGMKEVLEFQGHLWYVGSESRSLTYRGHKFFVHGISL